MWGVLVNNGADTNVVDNRGHTPAYYMDHPDEINLPIINSNNLKYNNSINNILPTNRGKFCIFFFL